MQKQAEKSMLSITDDTQQESQSMNGHKAIPSNSSSENETQEMITNNNTAFSTTNNTNNTTVKAEFKRTKHVLT